MIQDCISLWKDELETIIETNEITSSSEKSYYWFRYDGINKIISMNPYDHLESEEMRRDENRHFIIENKECLCDHGSLHPMKAIKGKYIAEILYNQMK